MATALNIVDQTEFDFATWMFGRQIDPKWARNTGYSLGYSIARKWLGAIVKNCMKKSGHKPSSAVAVPTE